MEDEKRIMCPLTRRTCYHHNCGMYNFCGMLNDEKHISNLIEECSHEFNMALKDVLENKEFDVSINGGINVSLDEDTVIKIEKNG